MNKREEIESLIAELKSWKENRDRASARRTYGPELKSNPLVRAIEFLSEGLREICICAAIRLEDGTIIRGHRHADCLNSFLEDKLRNDGRSVEVNMAEMAEQGFITSRNRFVTREEGRKLQDAAGIPSADRDGYRGNTLFSEDLY